jgi:CRP-like cAMP-binding protein
MSFDAGRPASGRPLNNLLHHLRDADYELLSAHIEVVTFDSGEVLYNPGDEIETAYFPCGKSAASFVVPVEDGREVEVALIGREGAIGGIVSRDLPSFPRIIVRLAGQFGTLSAARLEAARTKSESLNKVFTRYADCLIAQLLQGGACNAAHSIEQRTSKWILAAVDRTQSDVVALSHEQLAAMLGVGRSYASRVIQAFKAAEMVKTKRLAFEVLDRSALRAKACDCDDLVKAHFAELLRGVYPVPRRSRRR